MKKIILATVLAALGSTTALAADLGARAPYAKAPAMVAAVSNWSGFYIRRQRWVWMGRRKYAF